MKRILCAFLLLPSFAAAQDWRAEADARIEQHRKENVILIVTLNGRPAGRTEIAVEMVRHEFLFGCNIFTLNRNKTPKENKDYSRQFAEVFNFATLPFYWHSYERKKDSPDYKSSEKVIAWCKENHIRTKGHPLVWNTGDPGWIKEMPMDELYQRQLKRAADCAEHFRGTIDTWDVINEVVEWQGKKGQSPKLTELGKSVGEVELTKTSFAAVQKMNPNAMLLINDYVSDVRYAKLIEQLADDKGKPIYDAIGMQSHMHGGTWSNEKIWEVCERFAKFNKPLHFTEMTVMSTRKQVKDWWKHDFSGTESTPEDEAWQRDEVVRIYTMLFSHPSVEAITWWDFSDQGAWLKAPSGLIRKDMSPKPVYDALKKLIKEDWATNKTVRTNQMGKVILRAFRGEYQFTVTLPNGTKKQLPATVQKGVKNITLEL